MKHRCTHPPKHVAAVIHMPRAIGAEIGDCICTKRHRLNFTLSGRRFTVMLRLAQPVADALRGAKIAIHRMLHRAGIAVAIAA